MKNRLGALAAALVLTSAFTATAADWKARVEQTLPLLGHRNWIVIADAAYPWQISPGIETVETGAPQLEVLAFVRDALAKSNHVRPTVYLDRELDFVPEAAAPGITSHRSALQGLLAASEPRRLDHEKIIAKLDEAGNTFRVLLLKTNLTLPYTSVFLQLDCAYWDATREKALREAMATRATSTKP